jgi:CheY-like chemotaxis protein
LADVAYLVRDMMFTSKIREVARQLGVSVAPARDAAGLVEAARGARLVVLDLRLEGALEALAQLKQHADLAGVTTVGFVEHERLDVMDAARAAGISQVMAKGQFSNALPKLLAPTSPA